MSDQQGGTATLPRSRNILWRSPAGLGDRIRDVAKIHDLTQNSVITSSVLASAIVVFGPQPTDGPPRNLLRMIDKMNQALDTGKNVLGACNRSDWTDVEWFTTILRDSNLIDGLASMNEGLAEDTVIYSFRLTTDGREVWKVVGPRLATYLECFEKH